MTPDSLMVDPCEAVGPGTTLRSLGKAYVENTSCIGLYKGLLQKQREHKQKIEALYNDRNSKQKD